MTSRTWALTLAFGAAGLLAYGCSSDDTTANPPTITLPEASTGGHNAGGSDGGGGANAGGTDASVTGGNNTGGSVLYEAGDAPNVNVCVASGSYDNSGLPLAADGGLPPL